MYENDDAPSGVQILSLFARFTGHLLFVRKKKKKLTVFPRRRSLIIFSLIQFVQNRMGTNETSCIIVIVWDRVIDEEQNIYFVKYM